MTVRWMRLQYRKPGGYTNAHAFPDKGPIQTSGRVQAVCGRWFEPSAERPLVTLAAPGDAPSCVNCVDWVAGTPRCPGTMRSRRQRGYAIQGQPRSDDAC